MKTVTCSATGVPSRTPALASPIAGFEVQAILDRDASLASGLMSAADGRRAVLLAGGEEFRPGQREEFTRWTRALADVAAVAHTPGVLGAGVTGDGHAYIACLVEPSLSDHMRLDGQPDPARVRRIGAIVADVLATAHSYGLTHGAVCPATIMINGHRVMLGGFGAMAPAISTPAGLWAFTAPEHRRGALAGDAVASAGGDVFALAASLCVALIGAAPWSPPTTWADEAGLRSGGATPGWISALRDALRENPDDRPNAEEFAAALRQPDDSVGVPFHGVRVDLRPLVPRPVRRLCAYSLAAMSDETPPVRGRAGVRTPAMIVPPRARAVAAARVVRPRLPADVSARPNVLKLPLRDTT